MSICARLVALDIEEIVGHSIGPYPAPPDAPIPHITIEQTGGEPTVYQGGRANPTEYFVRLRAHSVVENQAREIAVEIMDDLLGIRGESIGSGAAQLFWRAVFVRGFAVVPEAASDGSEVTRWAGTLDLRVVVIS